MTNGIPFNASRIFFFFTTLRSRTTLGIYLSDLILIKFTFYALSMPTDTTNDRKTISFYFSLNKMNGCIYFNSIIWMRPYLCRSLCSEESRGVYVYGVTFGIWYSSTPVRYTVVHSIPNGMRYCQQFKSIVVLSFTFREMLCISYFAVHTQITHSQKSKPVSNCFCSNFIGFNIFQWKTDFLLQFFFLFIYLLLTILNFRFVC